MQHCFFLLFFIVCFIAISIKIFLGLDN